MTYEGDNRERAEEESRKGEAGSLAGIDLSPLPIFLLGRDGNFISANPAGQELLQASSHEITGTSIVSTYLPGELSSFRGPVEQRETGLFRFERSFVRRDGTNIPVEVCLSAMQPGGRQAVVQDISERKVVAAVFES